jgi:Mce-associated membrane protein
VEFTRTLASATGQLRTILNSHRDEIRQAMVKGNVDLRGELAGAAVESAAGSAVVVLVVVREYKITGVGDRKLASAGSFEVTMERIGNTWLASKLQALAAG